MKYECGCITKVDKLPTSTRNFVCMCERHIIAFNSVSVLHQAANRDANDNIRIAKDYFEELKRKTIRDVSIRHATILQDYVPPFIQKE